VSALLEPHAPLRRIPVLCAALGVSRATAFRWQRPTHARAAASPRRSPRALTPDEQTAILAQLHSDRFVDHAPAQVYATLLDEGTYLCSPRTMYRVLATQQEVRERRAQRTHPTCPVPRLTATAPNQVWTWDVTELKGRAKGDRHKLYVVLDLYSRYVVAWMLASRESVVLAQRLITAACRRHGILRGHLTAHSDRGSIQTAKDLHALYEELGITSSLSRPRVSNDNPHSESLFKTTKYAPVYPGRFASFAHAHQWCTDFFVAYNTTHRHSGIAYLSPTAVHHGTAPAILAQRIITMHAAHQRHPERFVRGTPRLPRLPKAVHINPTEAQQLVLKTL
jgi:putative transposase